MKTTCSQPTAIALAARNAGNAYRLAKKMNVSHVAVGKWIKNGRPPAARCLAIEKVTGVSRHALRPDIYPMDS